MGSETKSAPTSTTPSKSSQLGLARVNFLDLPEAVRKNIYSRVLIVPHPVYLFQEPGSRVETFAPDRPVWWLALLYTNRLISSEASAVLYEINKFHLVDVTPQQSSLMQSFLQCIGSANVASLSHLCINFPVVESKVGQTAKFKIRNDSLQSLNLLQDNCTNLSTLETYVHHHNSSIFRETDDILQEALLLISAQFKAIFSLKRIIIRVVVHDGIPTASAKDFMQGLGWVVMHGN